MPSLDLATVRQQTSRAFAGFTAGQKAMLGIAGLATIIGAYVFLQMSSTTAYAPLYSNLQANDASSVTQQLTSDGVSYKLSDGGSTVLVPQDKVYQLRLDMSAKGLPTDGAPGYALLDKAGITTSEFQQRVDYQRALEGEMSKTIDAIDGVLGSTVHLVIPQQDVFVNDSTHPSASVLVKLAAGKALGTGQVQSIVHLVASSVEGLDPDQVTVADDKGRMLAAPGMDAGAAAGDAGASQTATFQDAVAKSIEALLTPVTGPGKAKVTVAAQLDFSKTQTTTEKFDQGTTTPLVSETSSSESFSGTGAATGGALTTSAPTPVASGTNSNGTYTKTDSQKQYAPSKVTQVVEAAPGAVQRLSVAVLVDDSANVTPQQVQDLVTAAAGIDATRGDTVQVQKLAFDTTAADAAKQELDAAAKTSGSDQLTSMLRTGGAVLIVLAVLFVAWRSAKKNTVARYPLALALDPVPLEQPARSLPAAPGAAPTSEQGAIGAQPALPAAEDEARDQVQSQIVDLIDRQPGDVANVLRGWLTERR